VLPPNKKNVPPLIKDAIELIRNVAIVINKHKNDRPEEAISGKPILKIHGDKVCLLFLFTVYMNYKKVNSCIIIILILL